MNIDKVNATLGKALVHIQEGEVADLRSALTEQEDGDSGGSFVEEYVDTLVERVQEASGSDYMTAATAVIESMESLSEESPASVKSGADLDAWATKVGLADEIVRRLG